MDSATIAAASDRDAGVGLDARFAAALDLPAGYLARLTVHHQALHAAGKAGAAAARGCVEEFASRLLTTARGRRLVQRLAADGDRDARERFLHDSLLRVHAERTVEGSASDPAGAARPEPPRPSRQADQRFPADRPYAAAIAIVETAFDVAEAEARKLCLRHHARWHRGAAPAFPLDECVHLLVERDRRRQGRLILLTLRLLIEDDLAPIVRAAGGPALHASLEHPYIASLLDDEDLRAGLLARSLETIRTSGALAAAIGDGALAARIAATLTGLAIDPDSRLPREALAPLLAPANRAGLAPLLAEPARFLAAVRKGTLRARAGRVVAPVDESGGDRPERLGARVLYQPLKRVHLDLARLHLSGETARLDREPDAPEAAQEDNDDDDEAATADPDGDRAPIVALIPVSDWGRFAPFLDRILEATWREPVGKQKRFRGAMYAASRKMVCHWQRAPLAVADDPAGYRALVEGRMPPPDEAPPGSNRDLIAAIDAEVAAADGAPARSRPDWHEEWRAARARHGDRVLTELRSDFADALRENHRAARLADATTRAAIERALAAIAGEPAILARARSAVRGARSAVEFEPEAVDLAALAILDLFERLAREPNRRRTRVVAALKTLMETAAARGQATAAAERFRRAGLRVEVDDDLAGARAALDAAREIARINEECQWLHRAANIVLNPEDDYYRVVRAMSAASWTGAGDDAGGRFAA